MRIFSASFSANYGDLKFTVLLLCRPTPPWPSQDSLASCKSAAALRVHPGFFARNVAIRYVVILLFAMNVVLGLQTSAKFT